MSQAERERAERENNKKGQIRMKFDKPIALAADHGGYELKEAIKAHLDELGIAYPTLAPTPPPAWTTLTMLPRAARLCWTAAALAILCCGTGVGISMCANKIKGIRACCCSDTFSAEADPPPQQCQRPVPGRPRCGRTSSLQDRGRLPER